MLGRFEPILSKDGLLVVTQDRINPNGLNSVSKKYVKTPWTHSKKGRVTRPNSR